MFNYVPIKHRQMSFVSNGGKFKLYTVLNGLIFPTSTQPRISFERPIFYYGALGMFRNLDVDQNEVISIQKRNVCLLLFELIEKREVQATIKIITVFVGWRNEKSTMLL
jgi:hypothetical protein